MRRAWHPRISPDEYFAVIGTALHCHTRVRIVLLVSLWLVAQPGLAQEPDWQDYAALLTAHVRSGERAGLDLKLVDYAAVAADAHYPAALSALASFPLAQLDGPRERMAFFINAYNLLAIKMVVDHQPLASIKDVGNLLWPVWKRAAGRLDGRPVSLDDIEHAHLRRAGDPRVHFAIVCASLSCPDLRAEPYRAAALESQLDEQVTAFLANPGKGLRVEGNTVRVSKIFAWFAADFAAPGGIEKFIAGYRALARDAKVEATLDYDWRLNGRVDPSP